MTTQYASKYYRIDWNNLKDNFQYNDLLSNYTDRKNTNFNSIKGGAKKKDDDGKGKDKKDEEGERKRKKTGGLKKEGEERLIHDAFLPGWMG